MTTLQDCKECPDVETVEVPTDLSNYCTKVNIADGTYGLVTFHNGCLVDASIAHVAEYTPNDCCEGETTTTTSDPIGTVPDPFNLIQKIGDDFLVKPIFGNSTSISVAGNGTPSNPWILTNTSTNDSSEIFATAGNAGVDVSGVGSLTNTLLISHAETSLTLNTGTHNGITVDEYGHVTNVEGGSNDITGKSPIVITHDVDDSNEISLIASSAEGMHSFGGITLVIGAGGVITSITGATTGGVTDTFTTGDGRLVTVEDGIITGLA